MPFIATNFDQTWHNKENSQVLMKIHVFTIIAYWVTLFPLEDEGIKKKT